MTDPYFMMLKEAKKQWEVSSLLLLSQISDIREIEQSLKKGNWKDTLHSHISFLADLNNAADDFATQSMQLIKLQRFQINTLEETVTAYAQQDAELFKTMVNKIKSNGTN